MASGRTRRAVTCLFAAVGMLVHAQTARALEALDGRVQLHGFVEEQLRVLDGSFNEEADLAQWYNVLNLELEVDIAPNGFGPIDLLSSYVRVEGRYDCVYSRGCGTMRSVNTYGNRAERLPQRLRDAQDQDYAGVIKTDRDVERIADKRPSPWGVLQVVPNRPRGGPDRTLWTEEEKAFNDEWIKQNQLAGGGGFGTGFDPNQPEGPANRPYVTIVRSRQGFPGFDTLFKTRGADAELGVNPDTGVDDDPANYTFAPVEDYRWTFRSKKGPDGGTGRTWIMGPWLPKNKIQTLGSLSDRANPFRGVLPPTRNGLVNAFGQVSRSPERRALDMGAPANGGALYTNQSPIGCIPGAVGCDIADPRAVTFFNDPTRGWNAGPTTRFPQFGTFFDGRDGRADGFGGDFNNIIPCLTPSVDEPSPNGTAQGQINGTTNIPGCIPFQNVRATGGVTELPARPGPDKGNLAEFDANVAQGLYIPSSNLRRALLEQDFDSIGYNISESDRAWNRGQSQDEWKELKEAYVDVEMLDSRLWMRLGLQNIVWGKTELFRTTDQFNPQDLALASLASLEESRIALMAGRFVYSLYDIGPLEDVRAEFAFNFDKYKPADLGACGEAFTPDVVCGITTGLALHGITGIGIVGVDRPPDPWQSIKGLEIGGRVEWRWDRFSFAVVDFWGYSDFPFPDAINYYERNVDPDSGRPRIAGATGRCVTPGAFYGSFFGFPIEISGSDPKNKLGMQGGLGMGVDPDCLKAGAAGIVGVNADGTPQFGVNANQWDPADYELLLAHYADPINNPLPVLYQLKGSSPQNALENQSANQQLFAFICSASVTIAASVDPGGCAQSIFGSGQPLNGAIPIPLSEVFTTLFAGEISDFAQNFFRVIEGATKGGQAEFSTPVRPINVDARDGIITAYSVPINQGPNGLTPDRQDFLTLDSTLTNEQRAALGCGPFFGTRCDSGVGGIYILPTPDVDYQQFGWGFGGGVDLLNAEGSAILQSFPGFEGTATVGLNGLTASTPGWTTTNRNLVQPGTIGYEGGPVCTRNVGGRLIVLPGCRGAQDIAADFANGRWLVTFDDGYNPAQDGCVFARLLSGAPILGTHADGSPVDLTPCATTSYSRTTLGYDKIANPPLGEAGIVIGASTLFHPLAGCKTEAEVYSADPLVRRCDFKPLSAQFPTGRNFELQFVNQYFPGTALAGLYDPNLPTAQIFRSELAAVSWNMMLFLVATSCDVAKDGVSTNRECFQPADAYNPERCSFAAPQFCANVKGFLGLGGPNSNRVEAGGNGRFGRRDFIWHSGGELALRYAKRNVFGFSTDFAEDVSKTNWGVEFTWVGATPFLDSESFNGVSDSDSLNLTVSIDRPTFINFLNANRTFFFNTQWFFDYLTDYNSGFQQNGPFNALFTFAAFTGYYQDRLLPQMVTVFDFKSHSAGFLPSITYRFNEAFSVTTGINYFTGQGQYKEMPVRGFAPTQNRAGQNAYEDGVENRLSAINRRDEVYVRLRYTF